MQLGPAEILVVVVIALLVFGPTRLPEVGRQVGRAMRELKKFQHTITRDVHEVFSDDEPTDATHGAEPAPTLPPKADDAPDPGGPTEPPATEKAGTEKADTEKADGS